MNKLLFKQALGVSDKELTPDQSAELLMENSGVGKEELYYAIDTLKKYKMGKANLESRVIEDEQWWKLRHWEVIRRQQSNTSPQPVSAYLFNTIINKHADAMDNYPEPIVLPREESDTESAKVLSEVIPVILENNDFEDTYSKNWDEKLKHGTAVYGVFFNNEKDNGLGDVDVKPIDLLNIFWEPGISDIQKSRNLFITDLVDKDILDQQYPEFKGKWSDAIDVGKYCYDDTVDTTDKAVVVDWYYKIKSPDGRTILHYAKFVGDNLLYASENDEVHKYDGWYTDGEYPVVFDTLFREKGTPVGFGFVAVCKDPQLYIDKLSANIMETSAMASKRRYFVSESTNINEDEFADWNKSFVHVAGSLDDTRIQPITTNPIDGNTLAVIQNRIEEMKDTASNRDVNSGGTGSGVTAAAAITALQEAGNKVSRDMIAASYRSYTKLNRMIIERIRQFYDTVRAFRITGAMPGQYEFIQMDNSGLVDQQMVLGNEVLFRKPIFDLKIKAQKKNPYSQLVNNEMMKEFYSLGFFNPENAQSALACLEGMDFEGKDALMKRLSDGATLLNIVQQLQAENLALRGINPQLEMGVSGGQPMSPNATENSSSGLASDLANAPKMTSYQQALADRSKPDMNRLGSGASV